jgi:ATP-binding cassette, subfamily B, bacterial
VKRRIFRLLGWDRSAPGIIRLLGLMPRASVPLTLTLGLVVVISALIPNLFAIATGVVVGTAAEGVSGGLSSPAGQRLLWAAVAAGALFVLQESIDGLQNLVSFPLGIRTESRLAADVMRSALRPAGIGHLENSSTLDAVHRSRGVVGQNVGPSQTVPAVASLAVIRLGAIGAAVIFATYNPWLAVGLVVLRLAIRRQVFNQLRRALDMVIGQTERLRQSTYYRSLALEPAGAKEIRIFGLARWLLARFDRAWTEAMRDSWKERRGSVVTIVRGGLFVGAVDLLTFSLLARSAVRGEIGIGALATYAQAYFGIARIGIMGPQDDQIQHGVAALDAALTVERASQVGEARGQADCSNLPQHSIRFEGVGFSYPGSEQPVLEGLDLEIPAGSSLAVVGINGAGKTTLVKLLCGLYPPTTGRITVDGIDLAEIDPYRWQERIAAIFQDFVRYQLPVRANVSPGETVDTRLVEVAAEQAGATEIVAGLPRGWETVLDRRYQDGAELSGGQWQRIALARALYARLAGAGVLILDEPTANLDVRAEAELYRRFLELTEGTTTVLISHRFSTVRQADRIVVIDGGRVSEVGSHDELVAAGGAYARMFDLQAARFRESEHGDAEAVADAPSEIR